MSLEFRCRDVGVVCRGAVTAENSDDLVSAIAEHAQEAHGVGSLSDTLVAYAASVVRER